VRHNSGNEIKDSRRNGIDKKFCVIHIHRDFNIYCKYLKESFAEEKLDEAGIKSSKGGHLFSEFGIRPDNGLNAIIISDSDPSPEFIAFALSPFFVDDGGRS
jgi:hypothetical protein